MSIDSYKRWLEKQETKAARMDWATSMQEVNDIYRVTRNIEARREREETMDYLERTLNPFKVGDSVRLKDSPYQGKILTLPTSGDKFRVVFKSTLGPTIAVTDSTVIERVIDPQMGDVYEDNQGHEWIVLQYGRGNSDPFLIVQLIGARPANYQHRSLVLGTHGKTPSNLERWVTTYSPKLVRRRGQ